jgi:hypothetical protein
MFMGSFWPSAGAGIRFYLNLAGYFIFLKYKIFP